MVLLIVKSKNSDSLFPSSKKNNFLFPYKGLSLLNAYANYHDSVLDEDGKPKKSFLYKIMGGVVRLYDEGKKDEVREILNKHINKIIKTKDIIKRSEKLNDFEIDLEQLIDTGYIEIEKIGLLLLAFINSDDDLLVTAIENAGKISAYFIKENPCLLTPQA